MSEESSPPSPGGNDAAAAVNIMRDLGIFALVRTAFSSERSLLSWMRTSVSLYSFGFAITKFFDHLERQKEGKQYSEGLSLLGLALICMGILSLALAAIEHSKRLRKMKELGLPTVSKFSLPISAVVALLTVGIATVIGIALNLP